MIGADVHVNLHPIGTDLEEKEEDNMKSIFDQARSHTVYFAMSHMRITARSSHLRSLLSSRVRMALNTF